MIPNAPVIVMVLFFEYINNFPREFRVFQSKLGAQGGVLILFPDKIHVFQ